jgi:hypothetical protein
MTEPVAEKIAALDVSVDDRKHGGRARWRVPALARDILLIVLGALLAFGAEQIRDARNRKERVAEGLSSIRAEMIANIELVESARLHHLHVIDTLGHYLARHEIPPRSVVYGGIFNPATVSGVAWQAARESGVLSNMKYSTILLLAPTYEAQARYSALADAVNQSLVNDIRREGMDRVMLDHSAQFVDLATDFSNRERYLVNHYRKTLKQLDVSP